MVSRWPLVGTMTIVRSLNRRFQRTQAARVRTAPRSPVSRFWSFLLSLVPAITIGLGSAVPFLYWGFRLRNRRFIAAGAAYGAAACVCLVLLNHSSSSYTWQATLGGIIALTLACAGTAHALVVRHQILGEILDLNRGQDDSERQALYRISRREYARELLRSDPLLAYELRIGRPDLPRNFDDGGLIDINHASAAAIAQSPDIGTDTASRIVSARESVGGFSSVDDMSMVMGCAPQLFDRYRDFFVFVA